MSGVGDAAVLTGAVDARTVGQASAARRRADCPLRSRIVRDDDRVNG